MYAAFIVVKISYACEWQYLNPFSNRLGVMLSKFICMYIQV